MRNQIDKIDDQIVTLIKVRQELVRIIIEKKKQQNIPIKDQEREKAIIKRLRKIYDTELIDKVYDKIFESSYE